jgi:hypothetical protein
MAGLPYGQGDLNSSLEILHPEIHLISQSSMRNVWNDQCYPYIEDQVSPDI